VSLDVLNKAVDNVKQASDAVGKLSRDHAVGIMALVAKEAVQGFPSSKAQLSEALVSPPLEHTAGLAERFLEYAMLCEGVYACQDEKGWDAFCATNKAVGRGRKLLWSHPGGVCIPRHVLLRDDSGRDAHGKRRKRRLVVVVRVSRPCMHG
jgi:hypothetical protein